MGQNSPLSSKLAFDLKQESHVYPDVNMAEAFGVRLAYLTQRHITDTGQRDDIMTRLMPHLERWATHMGAGQLQAERLADWLLLARFVAEGGQD